MSFTTSQITTQSIVGTTALVEGTTPTLSQLADVDLQGVSDGSILVYKDNEFVSKQMTGAIEMDENGVTTIVSIDLENNTISNYVSNIVGTTGQVNVSGSGGPNATVTLSLPQSIATTSNPTFNNITADGDISADGNLTLEGIINNSDLSTKLNSKVSLTGVQTISGVKTFEDGIVTPDKLSANKTVIIPFPSTAAQIQALINAQPKNLNGFLLTFQFEAGHYILNTETSISISGFYGGGVAVNGATASGVSFDNAVNHRTLITLDKLIGFHGTAQYDLNDILFEYKPSSGSGPIIRVDNNNFIKINRCAFYIALTNKSGTTITPTAGYRLIDTFMSNGVWIYASTFGNSYDAVQASRNAQVHLHACTSMNKITNPAKKTPFYSDSSGTELTTILADPAKNRPQYFARSEQGGIVICNGENFDGVIAKYAKDSSSIISNTTVDTQLDQTIDGVKTFSSSPVVPSPTASNHAATKGYVDVVSEGLHIHPSAHVILTQPLETITDGTVEYDNGVNGVDAKLTCTNPIDVAGGMLDGDLDITVNSRVIVAGQSNPAHNGIYTYTSPTILTRATDFNTPTEMAGGDFVFVTHGTQYANTGWVLSEAVTTVGTSPVTFIQFSGAGAYEAGDGLIRDGVQFSVDGISGQIVVDSNGVGLATSGAAAGTYKSVTVDTYGRVTDGSNPTTLSGYGITDATSTTTFETHTGDDNRHLTTTQNTLLDAITVGASEINSLADISSNVQTQLNGKTSTTDFNTHTGDDNRHLTTTQNTLLDAITVGASEINSLADISSNVQTQLNGKSNTDHGHGNATTVADGFMSSDDFVKLYNIQAGAEVNVKSDWNATSGDAQILNKPATLNVDETTTSRTLSLADNTQYIRCKNTVATSITVPLQSSVPWPNDAIIFFRRDAGAGSITLTAQTGVTINGQSLAPTIEQGQNFGLKKVGTDVWDFI